MKKIILSALLFAAFIQEPYAQDSASSRQLSQLLSDYYGLKDALVAGNSSLATDKAGKFITTANTVDYKVISEGNINAFLKDATTIFKSNNIKVQRDYFSSLSTNMAALAKAVKLTSDPVYQQYCPMKKASWLSSEQSIKNPYFGSAMLNCGNVTETIRH